MFTTLKKLASKANGVPAHHGLFEFLTPFVGTALAPSGAESVDEIVAFEGEAK